ncbi:hypothetical protein [Jeotgalibacillus proteolyticus]|uniref:Uncharacterized protein n=1 Tax=Jeotgalibacillus proteolyticus TaxID=2082395 RepID=A0A2S5G6R7_9BACL|nr:hypothetical protein [Jeotgalibacillus proteolyticus]PPA68679.1 hypothetical protein C4B60_19090 [Jeotgalibacillus proteolyticus]PPA68756.1 hypothetical protein C4B60_19520 [Jeotgalibacillus proteolyticus]
MDIRFYDETRPRKKRDNIDDDFESQFSAATAVFSFFLFKGKSKENIKQINIDCRKNIKSIFYHDVVDGFWDIDVPYDPYVFLSITEDEQKRKEFLRVFNEIFEQIFEHKNWDKEVLQKALASSKEVSFKREFLLKGTPKKNPKKDKLAIVRCIEDIRSFQIIC